MYRRDFLKGVSALSVGVGALTFLKSMPALAARNDTLVVVTGTTINSLDIHRSGTNRPSYQVAVNCYDRLLTFGHKQLEDGSLSYDYDNLQPELAESWEVSEDGRTLTFKIRDNARFWDGKPVTAHDVKWSFDRAVTLGGFPTAQMAAGSLEEPEQFEAVDDKTFRIRLPHSSKLTLPDLTTPVAIVINSEVAKVHATDQDPWATEYLHRNPAGSGAFKVERWDSGQQLVYSRNDDWACGPVPKIQRVIIREIPSQSTRRALIERGDVHFSQSIPAKDARELEAAGKVKVVSTPIENCLHVLCTNLNFEPFQDKKVRQAIAYAVPYEAIFNNAAYGRGVPMWGGDSTKPESTAWPQPFPYSQDMEKAKALMAESGHADGFSVPLSFDLGQADWAEPTALLIQEALGKIGIKVSLNKVPGANWRTVALVEKSLPLHLENFGGWLNTPDYYFYWAYVKGNLFNSSNYDNKEIAGLVDETLYMAQDDPKYAPNIRRMIEIAIDDVPRIPLYQPSLNVAMQQNTGGYEYWYHRQLDVRPLTLKQD
ncbi:ABC transporter extracellular solute-binding protein [Alloalcanivorax dieselolei B5]|uniref:ABC transporter extracellular solute-binding protein n=1 Tax=Alcanivorax dieselolei (strain DSM 16502 / CGMCC 1.3690 / MCCC 1A00001 / B-5) TaxID=930169 RepID=K0CGI7_ALCDB|nr:ABC transporter substrate-binding protein [Alloalcanivorax dieselolei]AFT72649.1 ABC transporter extracellular solute-binding protein [Alloalcanivorax dieselolei B5]GGJ79419.1 ABC transporter substrate-binding protein [Alloalcanivorax dieselolei]